MPVLIPEAPIVNPNAALGTPPRLNSDGEADPEIEEILDTSEGTDEGTLAHFELYPFHFVRLREGLIANICYLNTKLQ